MAKYVVCKNQIGLILRYWDSGNTQEAHLYANGSHEALLHGWGLSNIDELVFLNLPGRRPPIKCTIDNPSDNGLRISPRIKIIVT